MSDTETPINISISNNSQDKKDVYKEYKRLSYN